MHAFISYNKHDRTTARLLATALVQQGVDVWFDEWGIAPGESLTGGIEKGLQASDVFVLVWSSHAAASNWVGTELRAYLRRRIDDASLRVIPIMLDSKALPILVADYKGFALSNSTSLPDIAAKIGIELRNQYVLGYISRNLARDGKYRKVTVKLNQPRGLPPLRALHRQGYYAPNQ